MAKQFIEDFEMWLAGEGPAPYEVGEETTAAPEPYEPQAAPAATSTAPPAYVPTPRGQLPPTSPATITVRIPYGPTVEVPAGCKQHRVDWGGYRWRIRFDRNRNPRFMKPVKYEYVLFFFCFVIFFCIRFVVRVILDLVKRVCLRAGASLLRREREM